MRENNQKSLRRFKLMFMQKFIGFLFVLFAFSLLSCNRCDNLDCIASNYEGQFRVISKVDNKDLIFGPNAIYDKSKLKFYSLNGNDTVFYQYRAERGFQTFNDSVLSVSYLPEPQSQTFIKFNDIDTDTLHITFNTHNTKCCGSVTETSNFRYNNSIDLPGNSGTLELRK